jgi:hypothetical protein
VLIWNLAAVSGIILITESGIWPFNFSNFNPPTLAIGAGSVITIGADTVPSANNLPQVPSPTIPSAVNPLEDCQDLTAASVFGPNLPIGSTPNLTCSFLTSSPSDPNFNKIFCVWLNVYLFINIPKKFVELRK